MTRGRHGVAVETESLDLTRDSLRYEVVDGLAGCHGRGSREEIGRSSIRKNVDFSSGGTCPASADRDPGEAAEPRRAPSSSELLPFVAAKHEVRTVERGVVQGKSTALGVVVQPHLSECRGQARRA